MLKRFLKLFKGTEQPVQTFAGSYLDHLLEAVRPEVERQLRSCPEHDPVLLVVVEALKELVPQVWEADYKAPLLDARSPGVKPPPAPVVAPDDDDEDDEAIEIGGLEILGAEDSVVYDEEVEAAVAEAASESDDEAADVPSDETSDIEDEALAMGFEETCEVQINRDELDDLVGFVKTMDDTAEFEARGGPRPLQPVTVAEEDKIRLDSERVLQAGRVLLNMLIDNDRLPSEEQLSMAEVVLACDLWIGYMVESPGLEAKSRKLLQLVEGKFSEGKFSQARILLHLFQTDQPTRVNNDRNLFYEDMILRLGIRRRHPLAPEHVAELGPLLKKATLDDDAGVRAIWEVLSERFFIHGHFFTRHPDQVECWRGIAELSTRPGSVSYVLGLLPPRHWRQPGVDGARSVRELLHEHLARPVVRSYVVGHLKACYFILRAVGDTGLEPYLDHFFDWAKEQFDIDATQFLPEIYNRTMGGAELTSTIFNELYDQHFKEKAEHDLAELDDDALTAAFAAAVERLKVCDFDEVAPGNYDFGALILDEVMGMTYPNPAFAFKLHRLT